MACLNTNNEKNEAEDAIQASPTGQTGAGWLMRALQTELSALENCIPHDQNKYIDRLLNKDTITNRATFEKCLQQGREVGAMLSSLSIPMSRSPFPFFLLPILSHSFSFPFFLLPILSPSHSFFHLLLSPFRAVVFSSSTHHPLDTTQSLVCWQMCSKGAPAAVAAMPAIEEDWQRLCNGGMVARVQYDLDMLQQWNREDGNARFTTYHVNA